MRPRPTEDVLSYLDNDIKRWEATPPTDPSNWHYRFGHLSALKFMALQLSYRWPKHCDRLNGLAARAEAAQNTPIAEAVRNVKVVT